MGVVSFLEHELRERDNTTNPGNTVALPPKGHAPGSENLSFWRVVGPRIAEGDGVKVIGVPIDNGTHTMNIVIEIIRDGGTEQLTSMLPRMSGKPLANLIIAGCTVQWTSYIEK